MRHIVLVALLLATAACTAPPPKPADPAPLPAHPAGAVTTSELPATGTRQAN